MGLMIHVALSLCEVASTTSSPVSMCRGDDKHFFVREPVVTKSEAETVESNPSSDEEERDDGVGKAVAVGLQ